jgi:mRNA-degrading endonuclease RelE of RelBE toxin-antitoxin system
MSSEQNWRVHVGKSARKHLARAPRPERERLLRVLEEMARDPFTGDIQQLKNQPTAFRRRVGDSRIFFDVYPHLRLVEVPSVERRTTTTYRRR